MVLPDHALLQLYPHDKPIYQTLIEPKKDAKAWAQLQLKHYGAYVAAPQ
ncbi:hypothetical protein H8B02_17670 [Bradyrhizobium sp. Pear77]|nr:hypothetical protein [Bradyrhizobium altum]MCC8955197.1 hypothetical protein [Bradyrhizobium altum]